MVELMNPPEIWSERSAQLYRRDNPAADRWAAGYGLIRHTAETQARVFAMAERLSNERGRAVVVSLFDALYAADRVASADMWLSAHLVYTRTLHLDGRDLVARDFDPHPDESAMRALNLAAARVGYAAIRSIVGEVRDWTDGDWPTTSVGLVDNATAADCRSGNGHRTTGRFTFVHLMPKNQRLFVSLSDVLSEVLALAQPHPEVAPIFFDGGDPAAFAWAIFEIETLLHAARNNDSKRGRTSPFLRPYGIGVAPKGAGFYQGGDTRAHALLLGGSPRTDATAARRFNESSRQLWVPPSELRQAIATLRCRDTLFWPRFASASPAV